MECGYNGKEAEQGRRTLTYVSRSQRRRPEAGRTQDIEELKICRKKLPYKNPTHLAQQQEPWSRLNSTPTITSMRRDAYYFDPEIPKDDLDFRLAALYNHHTGTFKNKSEILLNQKTTQDVCRTKIQFPGEFLTPPAPPITFLANIRHWINPKKESIHSIQGSIVSPHTAATNGGYSRKKDGGFFST
ncbi:protein C1orf194 homolog isoform X1 [Trachypithecus francoisi]|uniref:protein C1orf194 homolog isoform X1 n=1 Tax=Trachypithecus francoisi TaxID=54180 RepID=UPI00141AEC9A|nr:protein C1orf194 homolog isoform X1 [Trachypithecus francoisi]